MQKLLAISFILSSVLLIIFSLKKWLFFQKFKKNSILTYGIIENIVFYKDKNDGTGYYMVLISYQDIFKKVYKKEFYFNLTEIKVGDLHSIFYNKNNPNESYTEVGFQGAFIILLIFSLLFFFAGVSLILQSNLSKNNDTMICIT